MPERYDFDLITLGGGSGGVAASRYAASLGARVAICESDRFGGTCVIRGCVPKKFFLYAAQFADAFADAAGYGWSVGETRFSLARLTTAKDAETNRLEHIYERMLSDAGVRMLRGQARVIDGHTIGIGGERLSAQRILVATGGKPEQPSIPGIDFAITSNEILDLRAVPRHLLVLGAGYIATEFAGIFRGFGSEVSVAYRGDLPLRGFDLDLRKRLAVGMSERGVQLVPGFKPVRLTREGSEIVCHAGDGREVRADVVLNALGRSPNAADLGLEATGVRLAADSGAIVVDEYSRSSVPSIFAVGDVTNRFNLTPVAIAEGRAFVDTEFGGKPRTVNHALIASAVFSQPPLAHIGLTEEAAALAGRKLNIFESDFRPMKNVLAGRNERSYMKLVVDSESDRVLGLHMLGTDAAEIVQSLAVAVTLGANKRDFDASMAVHPTAAEEFVLMRTPRKHSQ
jgi:glutathione reductase (NADPH)